MILWLSNYSVGLAAWHPIAVGQHLHKLVHLLSLLPIRALVTNIIAPLLPLKHLPPCLVHSLSSRPFLLGGRAATTTQPTSYDTCSQVGYVTT